MITKTPNARKLVNFLTIGYIAALLLIAGISIGAHVVVKQVIIEQENSASTIRIAARQTMLLQRTTLLMVRLVEDQDKSFRRELYLTKELFKKSYKALRSGDAEMKVSDKVPESVLKIYNEAPHNLAADMEQYISDLEDVLKTPLRKMSSVYTEHRRARDMALHTLLEKLDAVVKAYEADAEHKIENLSRIQFWSMIVLISVIILEALIVFRPLVRQVNRYSHELETIANTDTLTATMNRRAFYTATKREIARSNRHQSGGVLLTFDLDHFKSVNDTYGHKAGDEVLISFCKTVKENIRNEDIFARIGGEEFALFLPELKLKDAKKVATKLLKTIEKTPIDITLNSNKTDTIHITSSMGITALSPKENSTIEDLMQRADTALYKAKNNGRNGYAVS